MKTILNIAAGKLLPLELSRDCFLINLDTMYYNATTAENIESHYRFRLRDIEKENKVNEYEEFKCKEDAFKFLERTSIIFDQITAYRFLEHVEKDKILYFIYLMSTALKINGSVDIIVPNYAALASMILSEIPGGANWESHDILLTTELLNFPGDPHASIWTEKRLMYFFELEGRFKTVSIIPDYEFDGRIIYLRYQAKRVK